MPHETPADRLRRLDGLDVDPDADDTDDGDPRDLLPRWLPDADAGHDGTLRGWMAAARADPGRAGGFALAGVAALAVLVTVFTLMRDDPTPVASAKLPPVEMAASASPGPSASAPAPPPDQPVVVSVVGLVQQPGLVTVAPGARVADALTAAGGALTGADTVGLNLARHLSDGEQVVVGLSPAPGAPPVLGSSISGGPAPGGGATPAPGAPADGDDPGAPLDLNTATAAQLEELPGIGPVTAAAIVAWREQHGGFTGVEQLGEVDGIGPARLERLRDQVRV
ncbi:membrane protein [Mycolicibacterium chitae]|nr:ComEA family DNA-binding protein [Mycolicibacterium chitae]BBZ03689.1 membrane protein [Mycolicibacterium chitae]